MRTLNTMLAAGETNAGLQREVNEDRFHIDEARGLFIVIDGVGGQAAGGKAADIALSMLRERLERETGPVADRVREAITIANNEIHRLASSRPEWDGMACVLTIAVVKDGVATVGHVGDTRLYRLRDGRIEKVTRDHSPVGEREDAQEISETEAMRHPRRNEVYRDVGSEPRSPGDLEFVEIYEVPVGPDDALLLCSDGLTDLVESAAILRIARERGGEPRAVVSGLIAAANAAGGKDNVTVVYLAGDSLGRGNSRVSPGVHYRDVDTTRREPSSPVQSEPAALLLTQTSPGRRRLMLGAVLVAVLVMIGFVAYRSALIPFPDGSAVAAFFSRLTTSTVQPGESIAAALRRAAPGSEVVLEPGEYRERVTLDRNIRLVSRVPRGATIRLPATASDARPEPAVVASGPGGQLVGVRIVGDARTPLGVGVLVTGAGLSLIDIEVSGASTAAVSFAPAAGATLVGSDIHDNPGAAITIQAGAAPRITHNVFSRNGLSQSTPATFTIDAAANPVFERNVFVGAHPDAFAALDAAARLTLESENWFLSPGSTQPARHPGAGSVPGRP